MSPWKRLVLGVGLWACAGTLFDTSAAWGSDSDPYHYYSWETQFVLRFNIQAGPPFHPWGPWYSYFPYEPPGHRILPGAAHAYWPVQVPVYGSWPPSAPPPQAVPQHYRGRRY